MSPTSTARPGVMVGTLVDLIISLGSGAPSGSKSSTVTSGNAAKACSMRGQTAAQSRPPRPHSSGVHQRLGVIRRGPRRDSRDARTIADRRHRAPFVPGPAPRPRTAVESRLGATSVELPKHRGRIDERVNAIGFDDSRFELALGACVQRAVVILDDQDRDGGAIGERREVLVRDRPVMNRCGEHACHLVSLLADLVRPGRRDHVAEVAGWLEAWVRRTRWKAARKSSRSSRGRAGGRRATADRWGARSASWSLHTSRAVSLAACDHRAVVLDPRCSRDHRRGPPGQAARLVELEARRWPAQPVPVAAHRHADRDRTRGAVPARDAAQARSVRDPGRVPEAVRRSTSPTSR